MSRITRPIPGNIPDGIIRGQNLDLSLLSQKIVANELFECSLTGEASELYGELGPNLISCKLDSVTFPSGVSHFDAKDTIFLHTQIRGKFDRIMATQCAFRDVSFNGSSLRDTVFVDSLFEDVTFVDCNFSVTTFKSNTFRNCLFVSCSTNNKLFEHCLFYHCSFKAISLQAGSILQNYGIKVIDTVDLALYDAETGEPLGVHGLIPKTRLERISAEYFYGLNLNESQSLLEMVQFNLGDVTKVNILHIVTGIRHLTSFLLFLYSEEQIVLFFPLQLFWSIDRLLESPGRADLPDNVLESLEISCARLRRVHEEVCLSPSPSDSYYLLIDERFTREDLWEVIWDLKMDVHIKTFLPFNSPSIAEVTSADSINLFLFITFILSTKFHAEIDRYQAKRKLLDIGTRLITDGDTNPSAAYQALIALNVPKFLYVRISAKISLSLLSRLRRMILRVLEDSTACSGNISATGRDRLIPSITILFLAANPSETERLRLDKEISEIDDALRSSGVRQHFRLEQSWAVSEQELQDSLLRYRADIVHLSAHGADSGKPILEKSRNIFKKNQGGQTEDAAIWGLAQVFAIAGKKIRCVVLNSCHSMTAAKAIAPHVDCAIGMSSLISDGAAIRFSWCFYNSLAYGNSVRASFDLAVAQLAFAGFGEKDTPRIFQGRSDPASVVLSHVESRDRMIF